MLDRANDRPGDVIIPSWDSGQDAVVDVTVISPLQALRVSQAGRVPGSSLDYRFQQKMSKYHQSCRDSGKKFTPLPVETIGAWHQVARSFIKKLGSALARAVGRDPDDSVRFLFQRLGVALQRGNAALMLSRVPAFPPQDVDGDMDTDIA